MADFSTLPLADQEATVRPCSPCSRRSTIVPPSPLNDVYSVDADRVNAFGTVKHGHGEIVEYRRGLFQDANFNRREFAGSPQTSLKVLTPEVVVVSAHSVVKGQGGRT